MTHLIVLSTAAASGGDLSGLASSLLALTISYIKTGRIGSLHSPVRAGSRT